MHLIELPSMLARTCLFNFEEPAVALPAADLPWAPWIIWLPMISLILCGLCAALRVKSKAPAWITVACLGLSFICTLATYSSYTAATTVHLFNWINLSWTSSAGASSFIANFALYIDSLTLLWICLLYTSPSPRD